jgi:hypothetical protein
LIASPLIILRTYFRSASKGVFGIVIAVAVAIQSVFCLEMHQNIFFFKKIIFDISTLKQSEKIKKIKFEGM